MLSNKTSQLFVLLRDTYITPLSIVIIGVLCLGQTSFGANFTVDDYEFSLVTINLKDDHNVDSDGRRREFYLIGLTGRVSKGPACDQLEVTFKLYSRETGESIKLLAYASDVRPGHSCLVHGRVLYHRKYDAGWDLEILEVLSVRQINH